MTVGASVHSVEAAVRARDMGAHYVVAGAIFATRSHPNDEVKGLGFLEAVCQSVDVPVLAIGGVDVGRVQSCLLSGASGVAVLSSILQAQDPQAMAQAYRHALDRED